MGVITLNVGGTLFQTTQTTLCSAGDSFFTSLLSDDFSSDVDENAHLFIDRDPDLFKLILSWLRTRNVFADENTPLQALLHEAQFYCLAGLVDELEKMLGDVTEQDEQEPGSLLRTDGYYLKMVTGNDPDNRFSGSLLWTQGLGAARHIRVMAAIGLTARSSLPRIWANDAATSNAVAGFMMHNVRRGTWTMEGNTITINRGVFQGEAVSPAHTAAGEAPRVPGTICSHYGIMTNKKEILLSKLSQYSANPATGSNIIQFDSFIFMNDDSD
ncbi:hypothetical protein CYMTET_23763 [Cymbomonas tetramitiformis]|uniref:BTB domain-containing protein n=1 Tax=Cymbomonas tetramitiformis TaxID=36881 RepID=A0AAE0L0Y4_9CHLO|nr:hypothetical protein CYMTET_23763 [Cymbomonas tetramitiformis]